MPPIRVRKADEINQELGYDGVINGYTLIPAYSFLQPSFEDDVRFDGCPYVWARKEDTVNRPDTYVNISDEFLSVLRAPLAAAFNLTDE